MKLVYILNILCVQFSAYSDDEDTFLKKKQVVFMSLGFYLEVNKKSNVHFLVENKFVEICSTIEIDVVASLL